MASKQIIISPYVNISEINPALDHYKIRVRVIRLWKAFKSLQMVLVDGEGTRIHASIEDALVKKFHNQLNVGESKIIDTFSFVEYDDVMGQIVGVGSLDNVITKGEDNMKISSGVVELVQTDDEANHVQPKVTLYEEFFMINENKTIDDILYSLEVRTCVTIGTICSVENVPEWYYIACIVCRKKVQPYSLESDKGKQRLYSCGVCDDNIKEVDYKYKLILYVSYGTSPKIKLLFYYGLAQLFVGKKADELVTQLVEDDLNIMPVSLSALIGKTMLFKLSIKNDNLKSDRASYVAEKFWEKDDMETYGKVHNDNQEIEPDEQVLQLKSDETISLSTKRELPGVNEDIAFRSARERFDLTNNVADLRLRIPAERNADAKTHNLPTCNEVVGLISGDFNSGVFKRDIVIESRSGGLQRISELHPAYLPLQYPLLFPYGEDGYRLGIDIGFIDTAG
ncbi:PREDICTED: uncharacterized protein LOC104763262 [Camelina sativa]|uniref:Uncharacterized protein LOC104763262 n=1 Tax=Camelina sativa TaxID=90675 RepID=A0ABM0XF01_CAMSA|nr:PREDICTED: uncharacterized protein LOC104763262 [Camelina sativa]